MTDTIVRRSQVALVSSCLVLTSLSLPIALAVPAGAASATTDEKRGVASAEAAVKKQFARAAKQEVVLQDPSSKRVISQNGSTTASFYATPQFRRVSGGWAKTSAVAKRLGSRVAVLGAARPVELGGTDLVRVRADSGSIGMRMVGGTAARSRVLSSRPEKSVILARNVAPKVDARYTVTGAAVKEELILRSPSARRSFTFFLRDPSNVLGAATARADGSVAFSGDLGDGLRLGLSAPAAWEARDGGPEPIVQSAHQSVKRVKGGYRVRLRVDSQWLKGKSFPIVLDPTMTFATDDQTLTALFAPIPDEYTTNPCDQPGSCPFVSGPSNSAAVGYFASADARVHSLLKFNMSQFPTDVDITAASLNLDLDYGSYDPGFCFRPGVDALQADPQPGDGWTDVVPNPHLFYWSSVDDYSPPIDNLPNAQVSFDVLESVRETAENGEGERAAFRINEVFRDCARVAQRSGRAPGAAPSEEKRALLARRTSNNDPDFTGFWIDDAELEIQYEGLPLPPPIPDSQTWGCECDWFKGAQLVAHQADPIASGSGQQMERFSDLALDGPGVAVSFDRAFNAGDTTSGPLGVGWTHAYNASISTQTGGAPDTAEFRDPSGGQITYQRDAAGMWVGATGAQAELVEVPGGGWKLTSSDGRQLRFDAAGRLIADEDRAGRGATLAYNAAGRLSTVTNESGQALTLAYNAQGLLAEVTAPGGRTVEYDYQTIAGEARLTAVTGADGGETQIDYQSSTGRLASITDPTGVERAINSYDTAGRVVSQLDADGNEWQMDWSPSTEPGAPSGSGTSTTTSPEGEVVKDSYYGNVLYRQEDASGAVTRYFYDASLNLTAIREPGGLITAMSYDSNGNLTSLTAPGEENPKFTATYNARNELVSETNGKGETTTYAYNTAGDLISETDPLGGVTTYTYNNDGLPLTITSPAGRVTTNTYDAQGRLASTTDGAGNKSTYSYDAAGNRISETSPRGNAPGATAADFTTTYTYDAAGRVLTRTDPLGVKTENSYDASGRLTAEVTRSTSGSVLRTLSYDHDDNGRKTETREGTRVLEVLAYDAVGRVASRVGPTGDVTNYEYDGSSRLTAQSVPHAPSDPSPAEWTYEYDGRGLQTAVTTPTGETTTTQFDTQGRPFSTTDSTGSSNYVLFDEADRPYITADADFGITSQDFNANGLMVARALPDQSAATMEYDEDGNLVAQTSPSGTSKTTWSFDGANRMTSMVGPEGNVSGANPADFETTYAYDADGGQTSTTAPGGGVSSKTFDATGRLVETVDPRGNETSYNYNGLGDLVSVTAPDNSVTAYTYDAYGHMATRTDARGKVTTYVHDAAGRLTSTTDALGRERSIEYDTAGNPIKTVLARGTGSGASPADWTLEQEFDAAGALIGRSGPGVEETFAWQAGRLTAFTDATGSTQLAYNSRGLLAAVDGPGTSDFAYSYDAAGALTSRDLPGGESVSYIRDSDGQISAQTGPEGTSNFGYDPAGRLSRISYPGAADREETIDYDKNGRVAEVRVSEPSTNSELSAIEYDRDSVGSPTSITTQRGTSSTSQSFTYNNRNWLTRWCPETVTCQGSTADRATYSYDAVGNISQADVVGQVPNAEDVTYTYDDANQLVQAVSGGTTTTFAYNRDGQLTTGGREYDALGRLIGAGSTPVEYSYSALGMRSIASKAGTETNWAWDINNPVPLLSHATTVTGSGTQELNAQYAPDGRALATAATPQNPSSTEKLRWFTHDALSSVIDAVDDQGATLETRAYDPWGSEIAGASATPSALLGFNSAPTDPETGDLYLRARDYDPDRGRFNVPDPIAQSQMTSATSDYTYADNQPTLLTDPTGLCSAYEHLSGLASLLGMGEREFCGRGLAGATAVNELGGGIFGAFTPDSWSDAYNRHVGIDEESGWYRTVEGTSTVASLATGIAGVCKALPKVLGKASSWYPALRKPATLVPTAASGADDALSGIQLAQQLARESAGSVFTSSGRLAPGAISESRQIIRGAQLGNKSLIKRLTADGSEISDWGKFTTRTHQSPSGNFNVHFYMNRRTGKIDYGYDYKVIFQGPK